MECCRCDREINLEKENTYHYDYMGDVWCKTCMDEEVNHALTFKNETIVL